MSGFLLWLMGLVTVLGFLGCGAGPELSEDRPSTLILVELTATDCHPCQDVHGAVQDLRDAYEPQVTFYTFDMTNSGGRQDAYETARSFGAEAFVDRFAEDPGTVFVIDSHSAKLMGVFHNQRDTTPYRTLLDEALNKAVEAHS